MGYLKGFGGWIYFGIGEMWLAYNETDPNSRNGYFCYCFDFSDYDETAEMTVMIVIWRSYRWLWSYSSGSDEDYHGDQEDDGDNRG